jgi:hypothetical protein
MATGPVTAETPGMTPRAPPVSAEMGSAPAGAEANAD